MGEGIGSGLPPCLSKGMGSGYAAGVATIPRTSSMHVGNMGVMDDMSMGVDMGVGVGGGMNGQYGVNGFGQF
jgi:hypothetical protein